LSGSSAPPPPNYQPIADAQRQASEQQYQISRDQLDWAKQQYADVKPYSDRVMKGLVDQMDTNAETAKKDRARYEEIYQPIEDKQAKAAMEWDSPERKELMRSRAGATVGANFDAADAAATRQLQSFGVNPSDLRMGAINRGAKLARAAAVAGAQNNSDVQVDAQANALRSEAINVGRGYPGQVAQQYGTATQSGAQGVGTSNQTTGTYMPALGNGTAWAGLGNQSLMNSAQTQHLGYSDAIAGVNANNNQSSGVGALLGAGLGVASMFMFSDKRLKENVKAVGKTKDGQTIYEYNFKGDPRRQRGLIAQEVEKKHPEAVHTHSSGYKVVDYSKAVPHMAGGGAVPQRSGGGGGGAPGAMVPRSASINPRADGDTVPAALEPGEMVIPKRAVLWHGEKHFQKIIQKADEERTGAPAKPKTKPMPGNAQRPTFVSPGAAQRGAVPVHAAMALGRAA
jgi:hypothetical protein